ncbi:hypothetical protein J6590_042551 [Homalodisca vitripennis]|nr:hypothetical protein J6590_042551 [Homalodisca vitripennis]
MARNTVKSSLQNSEIKRGGTIELIGIKSTTRVKATLDGLIGLSRTYKHFADDNKHYSSHVLYLLSLHGDVIVCL